MFYTVIGMRSQSVSLLIKHWQKASVKSIVEEGDLIRNLFNAVRCLDFIVRVKAS